MYQFSSDEYNRLVPKVLIHVERVLNIANRTGEIIDYLKKIEFPLSEITNLEIKEETKKILVIGYSQVKKQDLMNIADQKGFLDEDFDFELLEPDRYDYSQLKNSRRYRYVLVGPMAHNQKGKGKSNSMINEMEDNNDIYPPVIRLVDNTNTLKITISSFEKALREIRYSW